MRINIGVDLHKRQFTTYILEKGQFGRYDTGEAGYTRFRAEIEALRKDGNEIHLAVESTGNTRPFVAQVMSRCAEVRIVNTLKFKVVTESVKKTDKHDAQAIAEFLSKDMLPGAVLCSKTSEVLKRMLSIRTKLVRFNVQLKNQVHGMLLSAGVVTEKQQLNSKKGRTAVLGLINDPAEREVVSSMVDIINTTVGQIKNITERLEAMTAEDKAVRIIKTIPGAGTVTAVTIRAHIDDIKRFSCYQKLSSYTGLVPWVQCSDETKHYGNITKRGPSELRAAFVQMVIGMMRHKSSEYNKYIRQYHVLKSKKSSGKALVATARKLTKLVWTLLTTEQEYDESKASVFNDIIKADAADKLRKQGKADASAA